MTTRPRFGSVVMSLLVMTMVCLAARPIDSAEKAPDKEKKADTSAFMRAKLVSSQRVLEGLVSDDFDLIKKGANQMVKMSDAAAWNEIKDPVYKHYHAEFRRLAQKLQRMADKGNLEGASFTYMHTVTTCISCHEHVRDVQKIADDKAKPRIRLLGELPRD